MKWVALASGPGASGPDDVLACGLACDVCDRFVVAQWIKVVLVESCAPRSVKTIARSALTEVNLDGTDAHLE